MILERELVTIEWMMSRHLSDGRVKWWCMVVDDPRERTSDNRMDDE